MDDKKKEAMQETRLSPSQLTAVRHLNVALTRACAASGNDPMVPLVSLTNVLGHLLADFFRGPDRTVKMEWVVTMLPFYVQAYAQKEKKI